MTELSTDTRSTSLSPSASIDATSDISEGRCVLSHTRINVDEVINSVRDDGAGATAVFIGEMSSNTERFDSPFLSTAIQEQHATLSKVRCLRLRTQRPGFISTTRENRDSIRIPGVFKTGVEDHNWDCPRNSLVRLSDRPPPCHWHQRACPCPYSLCCPPSPWDRSGRGALYRCVRYVIKQVMAHSDD